MYLSRAIVITVGLTRTNCNLAIQKSRVVIDQCIQEIIFVRQGGYYRFSIELLSKQIIDGHTLTKFIEISI